jgi:nitrate reductase gamma subunit
LIFLGSFKRLITNGLLPGFLLFLSFFQLAGLPFANHRIKRRFQQKYFKTLSSKKDMKALKLFVVACVFGMFTVACGGTGSTAEGTADTTSIVAPQETPVADTTAAAPAADTTAAADTTKKAQ